jgi:broad specificity phosphatase PhoE
MHLLWLRHAESTGNQAGQIQGQTPEPLTSLGCQQATELGGYLGQQSWQPTHLYASPLQRAQQTAEILARASGHQLAVCPLLDLQEIDSGILQGLTWSQAQQSYPELCQQLEETPTWLPIPGAETPPQCQARAQRLVDFLLSQHQDPDRLWLVSHGGILPYILAALLGTSRVWGISIPLTGVFELEINLKLWKNTAERTNSSLWQIHRFNQTPHFI